MVTATVDAPPASEAKRRLPRRSWIVDAAIAIGLFTVGLLYRRHFPPDGLFYDDAWQAFGAAEGGFRQFITVGQTQPGFGLELMVWSRIFGSGASTMVLPAMIAGALGPAALYLVLRKFGYAVSISLLLGSALTVCETAITYSGRVKSYTTDVLVILLLCLLLPWLSKRQWSAAIAAGWFAVSVAIASFSSFALLATLAAGAILVLCAHGDRKTRVVSVAAQAIVVLGILAVEGRTVNNARALRFFDRPGGFIKFHLNPVSFGSEIVTHLLHVTDIFPGRSGWFSAVCLVAATVGLFAMARRGSTAVVGRFLVLMVLLAMAGSVAHRVPFGPVKGVGRVTIWLIPIIAFGLAWVLQRAYRAAGARSEAMRIGFDAIAFGCSALLLVSAFGVARTYPAGATLATHRVMAEIAPQDEVLITRPTMYTFALDADTAVRLQEIPTLSVGYVPHFADDRLHALDFLTTATKREVDATLKKTNRVYVVDSLVDPAGYKPYREELAAQIGAAGFVLRNQEKVGTARISVWQREGTVSPPG